MMLSFLCVACSLIPDTVMRAWIEAERIACTSLRVRSERLGALHHHLANSTEPHLAELIGIPFQVASLQR